VEEAAGSSGGEDHEPVDVLSEGPLLRDVRLRIDVTPHELGAGGATTRVTLTARFASLEDLRRHVEGFHAVDGARQLLGRLEEQLR
jgi:hypothetical protein